MKRLIMATTVLVIASSPAMAWDAQTTGKFSPVGQDGGSAQAQQAKAKSYSNSSATGGNASATGGKVNVRIVNSTPAASDPSGDPAGDPSYPGRGGGGGGTRIVEAPSPALALQPASGDDCPGVGLGAGGSGPTGAGILSYTWEGPHCTARRDAAMLIQLGHPVAATYVLEQASDQVRKALEWEARDRGLTQQHADAAPVTYTPTQELRGVWSQPADATEGRDSWCGPGTSIPHCPKGK